MTTIEPIRGLPALLHLGGRRTRARARHQGVRADRRGSRLRLALHHRPHARRQALLLGLVAGAAGGAGRGRRRDRTRPARHVDPDHAAAQPGDAGQGAGHAAVPVREPDDPRRRRGLERVRVRGGRRQEVGARQAHRRDARHHDPAARGRDGHLPRRVLLGRRPVHRAAHLAAAGDLDRRRFAAGRPEVARPAALRRVGQGANDHGPTAGSRGRPARRTTSRATGASCRSTTASTAAIRASASSPTRTSCTWC